MDAGDQISRSAEADGREQQEFEAIEVGKDPQGWTITLAEYEVLGSSAEKRKSFAIGRDSLLAKLSIGDGIFAPRCLSIKNPKVLLRLQPDGFRALKDWVGQGLLLRGVLKQRLGWALPIGILFLLGALPVEADVAAGLDAIPFDVFSALMGGFLLMQGAAAQKWPHAFFFSWTLFALPSSPPHRSSTSWMEPVFSGASASCCSCGSSIRDCAIGTSSDSRPTEFAPLG